jgi:hypothetical protein
MEIFLLGGVNHSKKCNLNMVFLHHDVCQGYVGKYQNSNKLWLNKISQKDLIRIAKNIKIARHRLENFNLNTQVLEIGHPDLEIIHGRPKVTQWALKLNMTNL